MINKQLNTLLYRGQANVAGAHSDSNFHENSRTSSEENCEVHGTSGAQMEARYAQALKKVVFKRTDTNSKSKKVMHRLATSVKGN